MMLHVNPALIMAILLAIDVTQRPEHDNKDQDGRDASATKLPRRCACQYSS